MTRNMFDANCFSITNVALNNKIGIEDDLLRAGKGCGFKGTAEPFDGTRPAKQIKSSE